MEVSELTSYTTADVEDLDGLMQTLSSGASRCCEEQLKAAVGAIDTHIYVIRSSTSSASMTTCNHIVASANLCVAHTTEHTIGFVEAVVVDEACRGQHLGRLLMEHIIEEAKRMRLHSLHLTSNPSRVAANALYKSMGFEYYETNVYKLRMNNE